MAKWTSDHDQLLSCMQETVVPVDVSTIVERVNAIRPHELEARKMTDGKAMPLLMLAVKYNHIGVFRKLLRRGASPHTHDSEGGNVLMMLATRFDMLDWNDFLMLFVKDKKAYVNTSLPSGWSVLMAAAEAGQLEVCRWLVEKGASINQQMPLKGWTCMHAAAKKGHRVILEFFLKQGGNPELRGIHRDFGSNLGVVDVSKDGETRCVLDQF